MGTRARDPSRHGRGVGIGADPGGTVYIYTVSMEKIVDPLVIFFLQI